MFRLPLRASALLTALLVVTGCSTLGDGGDDSATEPSAGATSGEVGGKVVLVTHSSFNLPKKLVTAFEAESGIDLVTRAAGDGGTLAAKLSLTKGNPTGDLAFGVDNTFASRTLDEGVFAAYQPALPEGADEFALDEGSDRLTPIDVGHVCVNVDTTWFAEAGIEPPARLADLAESRYKDLMVVPGASTSSPGMAFLLSTVAEFGDDAEATDGVDWRYYWKSLLDNGLKVVDGWTDAYYGDFTQGGGKGERPIVVSYDSSPAFTVAKGGDESTTAALLDTCFRQVEYAGVLEGADNPEGAKAVVDWLLTDEVQGALPTAMYVFPVSDSVDVPEDWSRFAVQPTAPLTVSPSDIAANREQWLTDWTDIISR
ncbi:thiamine ABC transporter substrate-binding protein [Nocardioides piscis]|uniref:Thiamine ABC transporter substrate-binding protein n=1 Tax=Nocardioides piscis TaxID=2714938 RepID=A0A6G7YCC1_9ACTN|nr:thiamine ABC transporter substrate-binding protein [Nocardioides piscis]QIK74554.1 thiamine ABC transporter substrate-binding protein [Nocardioides piscis]